MPQSIRSVLPNILTLSRVGMIPALVAAFYLPLLFDAEATLPSWVVWTSPVLFALAGITDFFDGYLARKWEVETSLGRLFDPIADKLLVVTALVLLIDAEKAHMFAALAIIAREVLVSGLREFLAEINVSVPVSNLAKVKTAAQMLAIFLLLFGAERDYADWLTISGNIALWIAALLTLVTGYAYLKGALKHV